MIIARTDAAAVEGLDAAIDRARAYADAGADVLFVEAPTREEDIEKVATALAGRAPLVFNWAEGGRTPPISLARLAELGFALVLFPVCTLLAADTAGIRRVLATLRADGSRRRRCPRLRRSTVRRPEGLPEIRELESRFGTP